jgi:thioredoxin reductase (NADPH)
VKSILLAVDDQIHDMEAIQLELRKRYAADYKIIGELSAEAALQRLAALSAAGEDVAILLAALQMAEMMGIDYLERAHDLYPRAKRVLLIPWGNRSATRPVLKAISLGRIDRYVAKSNRSPDEQFHSLITELLKDWQQQQHRQAEVVTIIGERWDARAYEIRGRSFWRRGQVTNVWASLSWRRSSVPGSFTGAVLPRRRRWRASTSS